MLFFIDCLHPNYFWQHDPVLINWYRKLYTSSVKIYFIQGGSMRNEFKRKPTIT